MIQGSSYQKESFWEGQKDQDLIFVYDIPFTALQRSTTQVRTERQLKYFRFLLQSFC